MNKTYKQALIIFNPESGNKKNHKSIDLIIDKLSDIGYNVTVQQSMLEDNRDNPVKIACEYKWDAIFIAGGDGTVNHTIQYLAKQAYRPKLGIFPFGTSNEFAKIIGMPCNIEEVLTIIERGKTKTIDIGKIGDDYFANIAGAGWLTDITYKASPILKTYFGEFAYSLCLIKTLLFTKQPASISINVPLNQQFSDLSIFIIMSGNSIGPLEQLIDTTTPLKEGHLHLLTCKRTNRFKLLIALLRKMLHMTDSNTPLTYSQVNSGSFTIPESCFVNLDGEQTKVTSKEFNVLPHHFHVFTALKEN
ncbi:diacylglycerol kinase (ATP) [Virgibacillus natechei]|uniref:Diacylglycerol kinase (ATP) n=1 Tax=Virgibacillus natechei TaxID=1216297 RepID=A0ABS4IFJ8_9BACI|nr:YegS/Rv2252/BmrU family lipid kinase [Virgibacillus natechei]MBP1969395.1 diacylglycerol kinase (ATP) [Virgibacillus natechei]UZD11889.1 YegS/Rv2252/BmrU family lipid kinase [Virgibacillus natechei]